MRAKRAKQYKKLMEQLQMGFGFHEPYQVLVDADLITEASKCKMDLIARLQDTLHGQVKPLITQCSMRHLYARNTEPGVSAAIDLAKTQFERRRCGHHPDDYPEPLSAYACINSVVDPKSNGVNKFRYCCAINDDDVRASLRQVAGVPLIYIKRSVMILEPLATITVKARSKDERSKFRAELKAPASKRKREDDDSDGEDGKARTTAGGTKPDSKKSKKVKGPNPLSVKKKKTPKPTSEGDLKSAQVKEKQDRTSDAMAEVATENTGEGEAPKKKRRRKQKTKNVDTAVGKFNDPGTETHAVEAEAEAEAVV